MTLGVMVSLFSSLLFSSLLSSPSSFLCFPRHSSSLFRCPALANLAHNLTFMCASSVSIVMLYHSSPLSSPPLPSPLPPRVVHSSPHLSSSHHLFECCRAIASSTRRSKAGRLPHTNLSSREQHTHREREKERERERERERGDKK